jgi:putative ABC transport system permease protein
MRFLPLLAANLFRKRIRTTLTVLSFAVALFLFCLLLTIRNAFNQGVDTAGADRLFVVNKVSLIQPLPLAYRDRLQRVPGVKAVTFANWFGGVYQDERNFFPQFAIDAATYRDMYPEFVLPGEQWQAFLGDKAGCIAGASLAARFGWKLGDRIPIKGTFLPGTWEFNLRGISRGRRPNDDPTQFWFRWDYLDEKAPSYFKGYVGWYVVRVDLKENLTGITRAIDAMFANSPWETRAQSEKALQLSFVKQMGNIEFLMVTIGGVVVFTLLLVTGNTMATAVRERTAELAVLKTIGFTDPFLVLLVLLESLLIATLGGGLGVGAAKLFSLAGDPTGGMLPVFYLAPGGMAAGLGLALTVGLLAGFMPALSAGRLPVVQALRKV